MNTCTGCNCHSPTESFDADQFGVAKHPGCNNDIGDEGTSFTPGMPCGFALISGENCDHPWWKHQAPTEGGTVQQRMLLPNGNYTGPFSIDYEPSAMYVVTFLGKECVHGSCTYVQKEGVWLSECPSDGGSPYTRCCSIMAYDSETGGDAPTGRDPWERDENGNVVVAPMLFDLRNNALLQELFANSGTEGDSLPSCCWCRPLSWGMQQSCEVNWNGWTLHPTGNDGEGNPLARSSPRITYQENNDTFWNAVGKPDPWYGIDSSYGDGVLLTDGPTQFALQNAEYWPSLPKRVCVVPVRWPYHASPCDDLENALKSCAPAENVAAGGTIAADSGCLTGLSVSVNAACQGSDAVIDVTVLSAGCDNGYIPTPEYRNFTLPSGVTSPTAPCDYWWVTAGFDDCTFGVLVYWNGTLWRNEVWKSTDSGATYTSAGTATIVGTPECGCAGVSYTAQYTETDSDCCLTNCADCPDPPEQTSLTLEITSDCPSINGITMTVPWDGAQFADIQTISGVQVDAQIDATGCSFSIQLDDGVCLEGFSAAFGDVNCAPGFEASKTMSVVGCSGGWGCTGPSEVTFTVTQ